MNILSRYLKTMQDKNFSTNTKWAILQTTSKTQNPQESAKLAIEIINSSKTEQEALERIQAKFKTI